MVDAPIRFVMRVASSLVAAARRHPAHGGFVLMLFGVAGCAADTGDFAATRVDASFAAATGHHLPGEAAAGDGLPPGVDLADGVDADEAVAIALWRSPEFAAVLADLGVRRAQLAEAGLLRNPLLSVLFPIGPKQLEFTLTWPLDSLLQRGDRVAAARADCEQAAAALLRSGLDLVRDVRIAWIDRDLARYRLASAQRACELADVLQRAAVRRLEAGDLGSLDADVAALAAHACRRECDDRCAAAVAAEERLWTLLAWDGPRPPLCARPRAEPALDAPVADVQRCTSLALAARPDARAAECVLDAASARAQLAAHEWLAVSAIVDANGEGKQGFEIGPGVAVSLPLLHRGDRVDSSVAAVEAAATRAIAVRRRIVAEVEASAMLVVQAQRRAQHDRDEIVPSWVRAEERTGRRVAAGDEPPTAVAVVAQARLLAELELADAVAAWRRARVELERAVGCRLPPPEP